MDRVAPDPRIERTKDLIWKALVDCVEEGGYDAATVSDICMNAGINRATLYRHYEDKDDALRKGTARFIQRIIEQIEPYLGQVTAHSPETLAASIERVLLLMDSDRRTFQIMRGPTGPEEFSTIAKDMLFEFLMDRLGSLTRSAVPDPCVQEVTARMISASLVEIAGWWISGERGCPADTVAAAYASFVLAGSPYRPDGRG